MESFGDIFSRFNENLKKKNSFRGGNMTPNITKFEVFEGLGGIQTPPK